MWTVSSVSHPNFVSFERPWFSIVDLRHAEPFVGNRGEAHVADDSSLPRILIVDDEAAQMRALCNTLGDNGYETHGFTDGVAALEALGTTSFDLLLADLMMPGMDGITLLREAKQRDQDLVGIIMTGEGTITSAVEAMKTGALDYILKPFKLSVILPVLGRALAVRELRMTNAKLERGILERTAELEAANRELEAFAYSVSHDLRSPLLVIITSAEMLIEDFGQQIQADAQQIARNIMMGAERMTQLINDLLRLSHLGRQALVKSSVDVAALVREVLAELQGEQGERHIDIRVGDLPDCTGDHALLKQVFTNLLSNAFKFTRGRETPVIEIVCQRQANGNIYCVRDNGAGFDMQQATELFGAFQRFHSAHQFEGTGVGLSIVHRIIQRHGGRVWADSKPEKGASFYFSLPSLASSPVHLADPGPSSGTCCRISGGRIRSQTLSTK
jgi:signal transduction histidine kinase